MKNIYKILLLAAVVGVSFTSCEKYLDVMPDNRAELDSETKIKKLLVSAYPASSYLTSTEFSSDNVDDYGQSNPNSERILEQLFAWEEVKETANDDPKDLWENAYNAISSANEALFAIEELGNPSSLDAQRGEALLARAYSHFILVNVFAHHYTKEFGDQDLGITYMNAPEKELNPSYERNTVKEVYDFIKEDIEMGIPLIDDASYGSTPKFHMNTKAAYAFAARVALYTEDWEKVIDYADKAIGKNPRANLRDNKAVRDNGGSLVDYSIFHNSSSMKANLMLQTTASNMGLYFGPYTVGSRFSHGALIANTETFLAKGPWGTTSSTGYISRGFVYSGTNLDKALMARVSYMFEYTDPVAGIGYRRSVYAPFTTEETLLARAEANIHLKQYDKAVADMKLWVNNQLVSPPEVFSVESINAWADTVEYFTPKEPTAKKKLNPQFEIEAGTQENMLHALLYIRRIETLHLGLRWFDIKRYGIEIERRTIASGDVESVDSGNRLKIRDPRHALQLPVDVISAGLTPNPR